MLLRKHPRGACTLEQSFDPHDDGLKPNSKRSLTAMASNLLAWWWWSSFWSRLVQSSWWSRLVGGGFAPSKAALPALLNLAFWFSLRKCYASLSSCSAHFQQALLLQLVIKEFAAPRISSEGFAVLPRTRKKAVSSSEKHAAIRLVKSSNSRLALRLLPPVLQLERPFLATVAVSVPNGKRSPWRWVAPIGQGSQPATGIWWPFLQFQARSY